QVEALDVEERSAKGTPFASSILREVMHDPQHARTLFNGMKLCALGTELGNTPLVPKAPKQHVEVADRVKGRRWAGSDVKNRDAALTKWKTTQFDHMNQHIPRPAVSLQEVEVRICLGYERRLVGPIVVASRQHRGYRVPEVVALPRTGKSRFEE